MTDDEADASKIKKAEKRAATRVSSRCKKRNAKPSPRGDSDDWGPSWDSFRKIDSIWGPHTIDRFANKINAELVRLNSRFWNPGTEAVNAFVLDWKGENNYVCPPVLPHYPRLTTYL